jgi:DNA-binding MarR family transcriptional regulator
MGDPDLRTRVMLGLLKKLRQTMRRSVDAQMATHDLTEAQWEPLWIIGNAGPRTPSELAREMCLDAGAVTRLLDRLVEKGFVHRSRSWQDRRILTIELTAVGQQLVGCIPSALSAANAGALRGFSDEERLALLSMFNRILINGRQRFREPPSPDIRKAASNRGRELKAPSTETQVQATKPLAVPVPASER